MTIPHRLHDRPRVSKYSYPDSDGCVERSDSVHQSLRACRVAGQGDGRADMMDAEVDAARLARSFSALREVAGAAGGTAQKGSLPKWRLKLALEYIDAHYSRTITLRELAAATGLSPMRFAAQFRLATGLRPREFILRRRIQFSQELLAGTQANVLQVALIVGFQTQAHFTTVFKRFVGDPPHRWRCADALISDFQFPVRHGAAGAEVLPDESFDFR
ncbi:helix-turn-helix domain-containing protein [Tardiphaga sp. 367_B4_N1_1]|uniref:helix-turn-helix domain-containing protein n=1 Tax=Tardiphaga sp. 367_B4_N1_1 TaxID=3240777 RepID=UPI003F22D7C4